VEILQHLIRCDTTNPPGNEAGCIAYVDSLLAEAGFARSVVYWQTTDKDGEYTGEFEPAAEGEADPAWITYVAACKGG
jgi:acetylornithine deacetylase/succinyl-diaminopimelate desuccinylase-like protein